MLQVLINLFRCNGKLGLGHIQVCCNLITSSVIVCCNFNHNAHLVTCSIYIERPPCWLIQLTLPHQANNGLHLLLVIFQFSDALFKVIIIMVKVIVIIHVNKLHLPFCRT